MPIEIAIYAAIIATFSTGVFIMHRQFAQQRQAFLQEKQALEQVNQGLVHNQEQYRNQLQQVQTQLALSENQADKNIFIYVYLFHFSINR